MPRSRKKAALQMFLVAAPTSALFLVFMGPAGLPWTALATLLAFPLSQEMNRSWQRLSDMTEN